MKVPIFQVDAFAGHIFGGNPAAVCPLEEWLDEETMQNLAQENNLSETAFFVKNENEYELRWFTPEVEVDLCGHATLATAHVLFEHLGYSEDEIRFQTKSGLLIVKKEGNYIIIMDEKSRDRINSFYGDNKDYFNILNGSTIKINEDKSVSRG